MKASQSFLLGLLIWFLQATTITIAFFQHNHGRSIRNPTTSHLKYEQNCHGNRVRTKLRQHIQSSFDEFLDSMDAPVLVDFYAEWCGPCRMMTPVLQDIAGRFQDVAKIAKIDVDKAPNVAAKYQVDALPTLILFYKGEIIDRYIGHRDAETLEKELVQSLKKIGEFTS